jgi:peptidoglycan/xylan/chitin deacetylase (PgdA/CDA1 family)
MSDFIAPGDSLAPFALPDTHGVLQRWQPGKLTVLVVIALWCDTWKEQMARLAATQKTLAGLPIAFHTISIDGRWTERGASLGTLWCDTNGTWSRGLGIKAVPFMLVVDAHGTVRHAAQGIGRASELAALIRPLLSTSPPAPPQSTSVFLTFDDFPQRDDDLLLDCLRRAGAKASFFCIGEHLTDPALAALARRALREGHALQVHSWSHDALQPQLTRCIAQLQRLGASPTLYRPPGHSEVYRLSGQKLPLHSLTPFDDTRPEEAELRRRLLLALRPGMTVLLHAGVAQTRTLLPELLHLIQKRGWTTDLL